MMISVFVASIIPTFFIVYDVVLFESINIISISQSYKFITTYIKMKNKSHIYIVKFAQT